MLLSGHHARDPRAGACEQARARGRSRRLSAGGRVARRPMAPAAVRYHRAPRAARRPRPLLRHEHRHRKPRARPAAPRPAASRPGDRVRVHFQVVEGTRRRTQVFEGVVIKRQGHGVRETFTVRKQSFGVGVERTFPVHSPKIEQIEVAARGDVRRAKLYYLRDRVGKRARVRERRYIGPEEVVEAGLLARSGRPRSRPEAADEAVEAPPTPRSVEARGGRGRGREAPPRRPRPPAEPEPPRPRRRRRGRRRRRRGGEADAAGDDAERRAEARARPPTQGASTAEDSRRAARSSSSSSSSPSRSALALVIQAFLVKPYRIPSESMVPTLAGRPARARQPHRQPLRRPERRRHRRLPPAGGLGHATPAATATSAEGAGLRPARRRPSADVNFIKRVVGRPGRHDRHPRRPRGPQRQARRRSRSSRPCGGGAECNFPTPITFRPGTGS